MAGPPPLTVYAVARSGLVLAGLLLLAVGLANLVAAESKMAQYDEVLRATVAPPQADPASLFPPVSEGEERHHLVRAKIAFYQLLLTAGQLLAALGVGLVGLGILRLWIRASRAPADITAPN